MGGIAAVLRGLLPSGYEKAPSTVVGKDVYAHSLAFEDVLSAGDALLNAALAIPDWLVPEYEAEYGLPGKCFANLASTQSLTMDQRKALIASKMTGQRYYTYTGIQTLLARAGITLINIITNTPATCTKPCTQLLNTPYSRFRMTLVMQATTPTIEAIVGCLIANYLPSSLEVRTVFQ